MIKYYPYKSDKPDKKYYIITNSGKKVYFGQAGYLILQYIKMKQENKDILIDIKIMKNGLNLVLIPQGSGVDGTYGTNQQSNSHIMILRHDIYNIENNGREKEKGKSQKVLEHCYFFYDKKMGHGVESFMQNSLTIFLSIFSCKVSTQFFMQKFQLIFGRTF
jgi:hypothetical protein